MGRNEARKPLLIFVVTEDWYFYSHRRPMIRAAQAAGFDVAVITQVDAHRQAIEALGVRVIPFDFSRRSLNPVKALRQICALKRIYSRERPTLVHHIAMKPILYGALAAWRAQVPAVINAFAGLGYLFNARTIRAYSLRALLWLPFRLVLRRPNTFLLFQNADDKARLAALGLVSAKRTVIIRGSGVDLNEYPARPLPPETKPFVCVYAGRMIGIKGLPTLKDAFVILARAAPHIHLHLYGQPDPENPGSWDEAQLADWAARSDNVAYKGRTDDMKAVWDTAHAAVQASYGGEGVPKSLLEAAACGRPIVATDVPGCREVVEDGRNGFLVPAYDAPALAQALQMMADDKDLWRAMAVHSRRIVESDLSADKVEAQTVGLYRLCLSHMEGGCKTL